MLEFACFICFGVMFLMLMWFIWHRKEFMKDELLVQWVCCIVICISIIDVILLHWADVYVDYKVKQLAEKQNKMVLELEEGSYIIE